MFGWLTRGRRDDQPEIPGMITAGRPREDKRPPAPRGPDLRTAMQTAVVNEAWLFAVPEGDFYDEPVTLGPYDPAACSEHLLRWFDAGLIELRQDTDPVGLDRTDPRFSDDWSAIVLPPIPPDAARALLLELARWTDDDPEGFATLIRTERGRDIPLDRWP